MVTPVLTSIGLTACNSGAQACMPKRMLCLARLKNGPHAGERCRFQAKEHCVLCGVHLCARRVHQRRLSIGSPAAWPLDRPPLGLPQDCEQELAGRSPRWYAHKQYAERSRQLSQNTNATNRRQPDYPRIQPSPQAPQETSRQAVPVQQLRSKAHMDTCAACRDIIEEPLDGAHDRHAQAQNVSMISAAPLAQTDGWQEMLKRLQHMEQLLEQLVLHTLSTGCHLTAARP